MGSDDRIIVVGAGIVGVSAAIWLKRAGANVVLLDRALPGSGTSHGNAGVLASCSIVPVTAPGLAFKGPKLLLNRDFPLFMRWSYLPKLAPWLIRYLGHANDNDTRRISRGLVPIVGDSVAQHHALADGTPAETFITDSDYSFAYKDEAAFAADAYTWELRKLSGFEPVVRLGTDVQDFEPSLDPSITCLASMRDHGFVLDPGGYVRALAEVFTGMGGEIVTAAVTGFDLSTGRIRAVETESGPLPCDLAVLATGVWSGPLMKQLGLTIPLESERGYHIIYKDAAGGPNHPVMIASGKFVATPMAAGIRCAGIVEFGGLDAPESREPLELLRRHVRSSLPNMKATEEIEWLGHRPAPSDSLPLIGEVGAKGVFAAFGHHHIGLTGGPKTGRMVADLITGTPTDVDLSVYTPSRFA